MPFDPQSIYITHCKKQSALPPTVKVFSNHFSGCRQLLIGFRRTSDRLSS